MICSNMYHAKSTSTSTLLIEILELLRPQVWKGAISFSLELTEVLRSDPQERQLAKALQEVLEFQNIQSYLDRAYMIIQLIIYIRKHCFQNCGLKKFQVVSMLHDQQTMTYNDSRCDVAASRTDRGSSCSL